jgi:hypothetical protein
LHHEIRPAGCEKWSGSQTERLKRPCARIRAALMLVRPFHPEALNFGSATPPAEGTISAPTAGRRDTASPAEGLSIARWGENGLAIGLYEGVDDLQLSSCLRTLALAVVLPAWPHAPTGRWFPLAKWQMTWPPTFRP